MTFDWSFERPRLGEVAIIDDSLKKMAERSFFPKIRALGYKSGSPLLTISGTVKIVRIEIYSPQDKKVIGCAIMLKRGDDISEAIQVYKT